ncbi:helix-turn-helix domain-containing protein [Duganella sp. FT134W]|uniref:Helix-turn-helix domain-containing protein n=2 Tax=Duganella margarita TaxID=2692170 RepID=A0A7X4H4T6_9BURK|nr:helix-turn-helix domain-containing protein [Duganella margarita]
MEMPDTLDIQQVSAMLFAEKETVLALARCGALPGTKIGRSWVFLRSDVLEFLRNRIQVDTQLRRREVGNSSQPAGVALPQQPSRRRTKLPELPALPNAPRVS